MNKQQIENLIKGVLALGVIGVAGYAAAFIITSLVQLTVAGLLALAIYNYAPIVARAMAHGRIKMLLWWIRKNPIEELLLQREEKIKKIEEAATVIASIGREAANYGDRLREYSAKRPAKAEEFAKTHRKMVYVYNRRLKALQNSRLKLMQFDEVIAEASDYWEMTQATLKANKLLRLLDQGDPMEEIRRKTALDAVSSSMNQVMAEMDVAMALDYTAVGDDVLEMEEVTHPALSMSSQKEPAISSSKTVNTDYYY